MRFWWRCIQWTAADTPHGQDPQLRVGVSPGGGNVSWQERLGRGTYQHFGPGTGAFACGALGKAWNSDRADVDEGFEGVLVQGCMPCPGGAGSVSAATASAEVECVPPTDRPPSKPAGVHPDPTDILELAPAGGGEGGTRCSRGYAAQTPGSGADGDVVHPDRSWPSTAGQRGPGRGVRGDGQLRPEQGADGCLFRATPSGRPPGTVHSTKLGRTCEGHPEGGERGGDERGPSLDAADEAEEGQI